MGSVSFICCCVPCPWGRGTRLEGQWTHRLPFSRSGDVVEYLLKSQWFVRCREMGDRAAQVRLPCKERLGPGDGVPPENWIEETGRLEALLLHRPV